MATRWLWLLLVLVGCREHPTPPVSHDTFPQPLELAGLHNVYQVSAKLISGSVPDGAMSFQALRDYGVQTIISVDGAKPDVAGAKAFGLRYVHLPIGYDGVPDTQGKRLAKAVHELPGLIYIHCHHGKHRSPAAVAAIQRCLDGSCTAQTVAAWLRTAGTDPNYQELHHVSEQFALLTAVELAGISSDFPEIAPTSPLVGCMVALDEHWDHLKRIRAAQWQAPRQHPAVDPAHEALLVREGYREALRLPETAKHAVMKRLMADAEQHAATLEAALRRQPPDRTQAERAFQHSASACTQCHRQFRDMPQVK